MPSATGRYLLLAAVSGLAWGAIGGGLAAWAAPRAFWGGVLASPVIGVIVAVVFRRGAEVSRGPQICLSLLSLYCAATLFGLAIGLYDWLVFGVSRRAPLDVVGQSVLATLWGLSFGYFLLLWPLAFLNHHLLWRLES